LIHGGHSSDRLERTAARVAEAGRLEGSFLQELTGAGDADSVLRRTGVPDVLVISYGPYETGSVAESSDETFYRMTACNFLLPAALIRRAIPEMQTSGWGRIVVFGGPRADRLVGFRTIAPYAAAKAALASLVRSVALETAGTNVTCNMISPGYVETEYYTESQIRHLKRTRPGGVLVQPDPVAELAVSLISNDGSINGAIIPVDFGS
jgi:3-oxoacyl-[acyl-carrier protein] reductase